MTVLKVTFRSLWHLGAGIAVATALFLQGCNIEWSEHWTGAGGAPPLGGAFTGGFGGSESGSSGSSAGRNAVDGGSPAGGSDGAPPNAGASDGGSPTDAGSAGEPGASSDGGTSDGGAETDGGAPASAGAPPDLDSELRALLAEHGVKRPSAPVEPDALFSLGINLFQSQLLSGNQQVSCARCHPIGNAGVDNMIVAIGVNGSGSPPNRSGGPLIHRNTQPLLNVGDPERRFMFWDGRVALEDGVFTTPAGAALPSGLNSVAAAQALFPLLSREEMLGEHDPSDANELADLVPPGVPVESDPVPVWNGIMARLRANPSLASMLQAAYPDVPLEEIGIEAVGNAIAAYQARRWFGFGPTNRLFGYIERTRELPESAKRGGLLFYGKAGCSTCHSGALFTDQRFHNLAVPQLGPGFGSGASESPPRDRGRYDVTHAEEDLYAFLTPSLWEVNFTFPYFHSGVYDTLEETVRHHLDPLAQASAFRCHPALTAGGTPVPCEDSTTAPELYRELTQDIAPELLTTRALSDTELDALIAFLAVLTDGNNISRR